MFTFFFFGPFMLIEVTENIIGHALWVGEMLLTSLLLMYFKRLTINLYKHTHTYPPTHTHTQTHTIFSHHSSSDPYQSHSGSRANSKNTRMEFQSIVHCRAQHTLPHKLTSTAVNTQSQANRHRPQPELRIEL